MLLLLNVTVSYGQTGSHIIYTLDDTLTCYTNPEMGRITTRIVRAKECDTLLSTCELQLTEKDSAIYALHKTVSSKDSVIFNKSGIIMDQEAIIDGKDIEISDLRKALRKDARKVKWLKIGWATTGVAAGGAIIYLLLK